MAALRLGRAAIHGLSNAFAVVAAGGLMVLVLLAVADIIHRQLGRGSIQGSIEISELALVAVAFLGFAHAERSGAHVRTTILTSRLSARARALVRIPAGLIAAGVLTWITLGTADRAMLSLQVEEQTAGVVPVAIWPFRILITVSLALLTLELLLRVLDEAVAAVAPRPRDDQPSVAHS